jgi:hypothetical protein
MQIELGCHGEEAPSFGAEQLAQDDPSLIGRLAVCRLAGETAAGGQRGCLGASAPAGRVAVTRIALIPRMVTS